MEPIKGIILYREDMDILRNKMSKEDAIAVIFALSDYAAGLEPEELTTEQQEIAFEFMRQKVDVNMDKYVQRAEKRKAAAQKAAEARWEKEKGGSDEGGAPEDPHGTDTSASKSMRTDASASNRMDGKARKRADAKACESMPKEDPERQKYQKAAQDILLRFRMNPAESNIAQVVDWIQMRGQPEVENAFVRAAKGDSRGGLSLSFVEAVMNETGAGKPGKHEITTHTTEERSRAVSAAIVSLG